VWALVRVLMTQAKSFSTRDDAGAIKVLGDKDVFADGTTICYKSASYWFCSASGIYSGSLMKKDFRSQQNHFETVHLGHISRYESTCTFDSCIRTNFGETERVPR
jgi:hypothetical protein